MPTDNPVSDAIAALKRYTWSPALAAGALGVGVYGLGRLGWAPVVRTVRALGRYPLRKLYGLTDEQWDASMDELEQDSEYRKWIPAALGALAAGGAAATMYRPNEQYGGLFKWNEELKPSFEGRSHISASTKTASFQDSSSYVGNGIDFGRIVDTRNAANLFTSDPNMDPYAMNMGAAIVNNASLQAGARNVTMGGIFDSAMDKLDKKLSFQGLAKAGVRTVVANSVANLFTSALDTMVGLSPEAQRTIIDTGTWAGAISAILE